MVDLDVKATGANALEPFSWAVSANEARANTVGVFLDIVDQLQFSSFMCQDVRK